MKGKIGIVVGFAAGYVLGSRAGRERYEQIREGFLNVWNTPPVQKQVEKVADLGKTAAKAVPSVRWDGAVKVTKAATSKSGTPGEKLDATIAQSKKAAAEVADTVEKDIAAKTGGAPKAQKKNGSAATSVDAPKAADA